MLSEISQAQKNKYGMLFTQMQNLDLKKIL
jgi:hypothetical protein